MEGDLVIFGPVFYKLLIKITLFSPELKIDMGDFKINLRLLQQMNQSDAVFTTTASYQVAVS